MSHSSESLVTIFARALKSQDNVSNKGLFLFTEVMSVASESEKKDLDSFVADTSALSPLLSLEVSKMYRKLFEYAAHSATHDQLTGALLRKSFEGHLVREIEIQRRKKIEATNRTESNGLEQTPRKRDTSKLLFIDMYDFRSINNNIGHEAGDFILQEFVKHLRKHARPGDKIGRRGGDEFVILCSAGDGFDKFKAELENFHVTIKGQPTRVISTIGEADIDVKKTANQNIREADQKMYDEKERQRNFWGRAENVAQVMRRTSQTLLPHLT